MDLYFAVDVPRGADAPAPATPVMACFRSLLSEAHALCRRQGVDLVVLFIPTKWRVYRDLCTFDRDSACRGWGVDDLPDTLRDLLADISPAIGYLDLTPRLIAEAAGGALLYLPDDTHWSAEGHRVTARVLAHYLEKRTPANR